MVHQPGQDLGAGDVRALFLELAGDRTYAAYRAKTKLIDLVDFQVVEGGKSYAFPLLGTVTGGYHTPGAVTATEVPDSGQNTEKIIAANGIYYARKEFSDANDKLNYYDDKLPWTRDMGKELAHQTDRDLMKCFLASARGAEDISGETGKVSITATASAGTDPVVLAALIVEAAAGFEDIGADEDELVALVRPKMFKLLSQTGDLVSTDFSQNGGDSAEGIIHRIGGVRIMSIAQHAFPKTDNSAVAIGSGDFNDVFGTGFDADWRKTACVVATKEAVGMVSLMAPNTEQYRTDDFSDSVKVAQMQGMAPVRHSAAVEILDTVNIV